MEVCQLALAGGELPVNGGDRPQLVITVPFDLLRHELGTGTLDTGDRLSPTPSAGWPATPTSSPPSSAATAKSSTSANGG